MDKLEFEWDEQKAIANQQKHNVSFEEARSVFYNRNACFIYDPEHSLNEDRYILLGVSDSMK